MKKQIEYLKQYEFPQFTPQQKYHSRSPSNLIYSLKPEFDRDRISKATARNTGKTQSQVLAEWDAKGAASRQLGSELHEYIVNVLSGKVSDPIEAMSSKGPHQDQFDLFWKSASENFMPIWTEKYIRSPRYRLSGRIDALLYSLKTNQFHIVDWKSGSYSTTGWNDLFAPFEDLMDRPGDLGAIQTTCYRLAVENETGVELGDSYLGYISDSSYQLVAMADLRERVGKWLLGVA